MRNPRSHRLTPKGDSLPSLPLELCLAKTRGTDNSGKLAGRSVLEHCSIVGAIARELITRSPKFLRDSVFPQGSALIAASHDIGKISPTFQKKIHSSVISKDEKILDSLASVDQDIEINWGGHAGISQATLECLNAGKYIPEIVGLHHGAAPNLGGKTCNAEQFGGLEWQRKRAELCDILEKSMNESFPVISNILQARVLAGLTCVADWIGSGFLFDDPDLQWKNLIHKAVDSAGFLKPCFLEGLSFREVFGFEPRTIQQQLIDLVSGPGTYILEAPMGIGKTEAALFAAYLLVASGKATGIYFALPTQLTSDRIHTRVHAFLQKVLDPTSPHRESLLLHSNAWLKEFELGKEGAPGHSWFHASKRGLLAPFAVGTIDQALMASMNVKHGFVRTFGLAGKVVILDEVHTYDAYTGTILDRMVEELNGLHCTVIILSATLTNERRLKLLGTEPSGDAAYPVISALPQNIKKLIELKPSVLPGNTVTVNHISDIDEALEEALARAEEDQQVLWLENTVADAQQVFSILAARSAGMGIECGLLHSRFIQKDRAKLEEHWVSRYGKDSGTLRNEKGRILIGTQVLEQSLDIDADFLITRICPTDMLLQRTGRLWRHNLHRRPNGAVCEVWILTTDLSTALIDPKKAFGKTASVYSLYVLLRTLQTWEEVKILSLPGDIHRLLETTYEPRDESEIIQQYKAELENKKQRLWRFALQSTAKDIGTLPDSEAKTRYSDIETVELLLLRSLKHEREKGGVSVTLLDGETLFLPATSPPESRKEQRKLSAILARQTLNVALYDAPSSVRKNDLEWLKPYFYLGDMQCDESIMRVAIVGEDGLLKAPVGGRSHESKVLCYNARLGYQSRKNNF